MQSSGGSRLFKSRQTGDAATNDRREQATSDKSAGWTYTRRAHTPYTLQDLLPPVSVFSDSVGESPHNTTQCLRVAWDPHTSRPARAPAAIIASGTTLFVTLATVSESAGARANPKPNTATAKHSNTSRGCWRGVPQQQQDTATHITKLKHEDSPKPQYFKSSETKVVFSKGGVLTEARLAPPMSFDHVQRFTGSRGQRKLWRLAESMIQA